MRKLKLARERRAQLLNDERAHLEQLRASESALVGDDKLKYDARRQEITQLDADIAGYEALEAETRRNAEEYARLNPERPADRQNDDQRPTFSSFGEQLQAIAFAHMPGRIRDERLATGAGANVPSDGGFLIESQFTTALLNRARETSLLLGRTTQIPVTVGDGLEAPFIDETSRANGSRWGGVQVYWEGEADAPTATKPKIGLHEIKLGNLKGLAYVTERLLEDAPQMQAIFENAFASEFAFKVDDGIMNGNGAAQALLGYLQHSDALVVVAKESGQPANTVYFPNIVKMWARMPASSQSNAIWIVNQEVLPQLALMAFDAGATNKVPVYLPAGTVANTPFGTLMGRPVVVAEQAKALSTQGDISLVDLSRYVTISKGGLRSASSMHVRFIYDEMTFKWSYRLAGQPMIRKAITPANGTSTLSPFVTLASR